MTLREQALLAVLTLLVIPTLLKIFDKLMAMVRVRFGTSRKLTYGELEQLNWRLRDTLRRVYEGAAQIEKWQSEGKTDLVLAGVANLKSEIDPQLLQPMIPKVEDP